MSSFACLSSPVSLCMSTSLACLPFPVCLHACLPPCLSNFPVYLSPVCFSGQAVFLPYRRKSFIPSIGLSSFCQPIFLMSKMHLLYSTPHLSAFRSAFPLTCFSLRFLLCSISLLVFFSSLKSCLFLSPCLSLFHYISVPVCLCSL
jgi:hypothetical protein